MGKLRLKIDIDGRIIELYSDDNSESESKSEVSVGNKDIGDKIDKMTIKKLQFKKEVYKPCKIEAVTQISLNKGYKISRQEIIYLFKGNDGQKNVVSLDYMNGKEIKIAENYYIHEIIPQYFKTGEVFVTLKIFSRDKLLTIDKYCNAYTGRKFFTNIINANFPEGFKCIDNIISEAGIEIDNTNIVDPISKDTNSSKLTGEGDRKLVFLGYKKDDGKPNEYIQPYLVQYNESFYDFMVRVANRCGEFVFFEEGKLCIGFKYKGVMPTQKISNYTSISFKDVSNGIVVPNDFTHYFNGSVTIENYNKQESAGGKDGNNKKNEDNNKTEQTQRVYNTEMPTEDYLDVIEKNSFTSYKKKWDEMWGSELFKFITMVLLSNEPSLYKKLLLGGLREAVCAAFTPVIVKEENDEGNKKYVLNMPDDQKAKDDAKSAQFSTLKDKTVKELKFKQEFNSLFYSTVRTAEKEVSKNAVVIDLGVNMIDIKLGDKVTIDTEGDKSYIVIGIEGNSYVDNDKTQTDYSLTLIPYYTYEGTEIECPPLVVEDPIRHASPQVAVIADSDDPKGIGRVRIRYPWQDDGADPSPWIRMVTPFATDGGGMYFKPNEGDEVLVNYENGNIERPYVTGSLYTSNVNVPNGERIISSANGHSIKMTDPDSIGEFTDELWGGFSIIRTFYPKLLNKTEDKIGLTGGIELTDRYGIYKIKMSSSKRKIAISSPLGNVKIDAFTGISLSAPNGTVTIEGKNVNIIAGNTLKISSGENIPDKNPEMGLETDDEQDAKISRRSGKIEKYFEDIYDNYPAYVQPVAGTVAAMINSYNGKSKLFKPLDCIVDNFLMPLVDLSLVRTLIESIIKPTAGTMVIKSWRYMMLEAGVGRTSIPQDAYTISGRKEVDKEDAYLENVNKDLAEIISLSKDFISVADKYIKIVNSLYDNSLHAIEDAGVQPKKDNVKNITNRDTKIKDFKLEDYIETSNGDLKEKRQPIIKTLEALNDRALALRSILGNIDSLIRCGLKNKNFLNKIDVPDFLKNEVGTDYSLNRENCNEFIRQLLYEYLTHVEKIEYDKINESDVIKDKKWREFIWSIDLKITKSDEFRNHLKDWGNNALAEIDIPSWIMARNVWSPYDGGQILMSDKHNKTINFEENGNSRSSENIESDKQIIDCIKDTLKKI